MKQLESVCCHIERIELEAERNINVAVHTLFAAEDRAAACESFFTCCRWRPKHVGIMFVNVKNNINLTCMLSH